MWGVGFYGRGALQGGGRGKTQNSKSDSRCSQKKEDPMKRNAAARNSPKGIMPPGQQRYRGGVDYFGGMLTLGVVSGIYLEICSSS